MEPRLNTHEANPQVVSPMMGMVRAVRESGIDRKLKHLIDIRASQINGCGYCLDMHTQEARADGETEQRIYVLSAWRDAPFYSDAERVALELTEAVTLISEGGVSDDLYKRVREHYDEAQFVALLMAINTINCWNRLSIASGNQAGRYHPGEHD